MKRIFGSLVLTAILASVLASASPAPSRAREQRIAVTVTSKGFEPSTIHARSGQPLVLVVTRTAEKTCAKEIVIKERRIRQALPLNQAVEIRLTPQKAGTLRYACGMDMVSGTLVIE